MPWNGSLTVYNKLIRPVILKHQKKIDETLSKAAGAAKTALDEGFSSVHSYLAVLKLIESTLHYSFSVTCVLCTHVCSR